MSKKKNNPFADLEKSHSRDFREGNGHHKVQRGLDSTLGTARMLGSIADVYLSRFIGTVMSMAGSQDDQERPGEGEVSERKKYPNL